MVIVFESNWVINHLKASIDLFIFLLSRFSMISQHEETTLHLVSKYDHAHLIPIFAAAKVNLDMRGKVRIVGSLSLAGPRLAPSKSAVPTR